MRARNCLMETLLSCLGASSEEFQKVVGVRYARRL
jgi:hypothetical protein